MKIAPRRSIACSVFGIFLAVSLLLVLNSSDSAQAGDNYHPVLTQKLCNAIPATFPDVQLAGDSACTNPLGAMRGATDVPRTTTTRLNLPNTDLQFSNLVTYEPDGINVTPGCNIDTDVFLTGTATGGTISTLTDAAAPFGADDSQVGRWIGITGGTGIGQGRWITANTDDTVTVSDGSLNNPDNWKYFPNATSEYSIGDGIADDREYTTGAPANQRTSGDGIDNDDDGFTDEDSECLRPGDKLGALRNAVSLGTLNGPCNQLQIYVDFTLYNIALPNNASDPRTSTNIYTPLDEGVGDRIQNGAKDPLNDNMADADSPGILNTPDWLLDLFDPDWLPVKPPYNGPRDPAYSSPGDGRQNSADGDKKPLIPIAVYGGISEIAGTWTPLYFVQFDSGQLSIVDNADGGFAPPHPFSRAEASLGKPSQIILTDTSPIIVSVSTITDFCSQLISDTMLLGTTATDGVQRATNPDDAGSHPALAWTMSQRDLDNDSFEGQIDTCPTLANIDTDPRAMGTFSPPNPPGDDEDDPDGDMIDAACDPDPILQGCGSPWPDALAGTDCDADTFQNAQDNCPLVYNIDQTESELLQAYGDAAEDGGPKSDGMGDECDVAGTAKFIQNQDPLLTSTATGPGSSTDTLEDTVEDLSGYSGDCVEITGGAGAAQARSITAATVDEITVDSDWKVAIDDTSDYLIGPCTEVTLSPTVANGVYYVHGTVMPTCYGAAKLDADNDGWCSDTGGENDTDAVLHPPLGTGTFGINLTAGDHDGDGGNAWIETFIGSDDAKDCNRTIGLLGQNDEPLDGWITDFNDDMGTDIFDVNILKPAFFKIATDLAYVKRADLNASSGVDIFDVNILKPNFFGSCDWDGQQ